MVEKTNHFLSLKQVTIRDPFFSPVQNTVIHTMIPYQEKVLHDEIPDIRPSHVIRNYRIAAGEIEGTYYGRVFQDSDLAKWLEAVAYSLTVQTSSKAGRLPGYILYRGRTGDALEGSRRLP